MHSTIDDKSSLPAADSDEFLSRAEVAQLFNVSPSTVTRWADAGKLSCIRTLGGHRRYATTSVLEQVRGLQKEKSRLKSLDLTIARMYGDHHTLAVQQTLHQLPGIDSVRTNTARRQVHIDFDEEVTSKADILAQLESAGYPTHNGGQAIPLDKTHKDPAWARLSLRMTQTHPTSA
ncbi:MAG: helix-turn-helix domain-containing protein [Chloroflexi bacterium]|nr:helix-turn-helix domain-containing protein [Chloroflexota bacterium]